MTKAITQDVKRRDAMSTYMSLMAGSITVLVLIGGISIPAAQGFKLSPYGYGQGPATVSAGAPSSDARTGVTSEGGAQVSRAGETVIHKNGPSPCYGCGTEDEQTELEHLRYLLRLPPQNREFDTTQVACRATRLRSGVGGAPSRADPIR